MKKVFQLWGLSPDIASDEQLVLNAVHRMLEAKPDYLVAGQTPNKQLLQTICDLAHKQGVKVHQWSSLFSENDFAKPFDPVIGADGRPHERVFGDNFNFRCSASDKNVQLFIDMQRESMKDTDIDGVFLDRVRYPALGNGPMACFCPDCLKRYEEAGIDADAVRAQTDYGIIGYERGRHLFKDENTAKFFAHRAERITRAVQTIKDAFGEVSLDLFPPALAYIMGQDLESLAPLAAFSKPMFYRYTTAPAGLPFELADFPQFSMPEDEQIKQYEAISSGLYWGVEGGFYPGVVEMTPDRIRESLHIIRENGGSGVCASWCMVNVPKENLDVFMEA